MTVKNSVLSILRRVEDFFIPPLCIVCDGALSDDRGIATGGRWLCPTCAGALSENSAKRDACPLCARNRKTRECACEFAWDFPFERAFSVYDYDDTLSVIAKHIKYKGKSRLAYYMGMLCADAIPSAFWEGASAVVPVPLHKKKQRRRGYNQAEHFARGVLAGLNGVGVDGGVDGDPELSRISGLLRIDLLKRIKNTGTQTKLNREERMKNLKGAFAVNPQTSTELKGMRIILVDDILTTGATAEGCTEELLRAGCASVRVLSMGRD